MSIFKRLFKLGQSSAHAAIDKLEDPIKLTEQGLRDLRKDLQETMQSLAEAKAVTIRLRRESETKKSTAADYERKAILLLKKGEAGTLSPGDADRLATEALNKKEQAMQQAMVSCQSLDKQEQMVQKLQTNVQTLKSKISHWEGELVTLKSRSKVATATRKLNQQLAQVDSNGTLAMLEKMKQKVEEEEALSESYGSLQLESNVDDEINKALTQGDGANAPTSDALAALKARLKQG